MESFQWKAASYKLEHAGIVWSKTVPSQIKQMQQSLPILVIGCDSKGANTT
jgi:hypothetical protein